MNEAFEPGIYFLGLVLGYGLGTWIFFKWFSI
jgi:hypothetical protein